MSTNGELKFGLIGSSLSHSKSIKIQNAAFKHLKVNASYENFEIPVENFDRGIIDLLQKVDGLNITIPFKEKILKYLNRSDEIVKRIGAANTVYLTEMGIIGYNTDHEGFLESLKKYPELKEKKVALIGAGGAAKAIIVALEDLGLNEITIYARNLTKVEENLPKAKRSMIKVELLDEAADLTDINLLINCTPIGQGRLSDQMPINKEILETLEKNAIVYDLIYEDTKLLQTAKELGLNTISGKEMLIRQAMHSIKIWTGKDINEDLYSVMNDAFDS